MWAYLKKRALHKVLLLLLVDICLIALAIYCGYMIKFSLKTLHFSFDIAFKRANFFLFVSIFSHVIFLYAYGLYAVVRPNTPIRVFLSICFTIATSTGVLMLLQFFAPGYWVGRVVLIIQIPFAILLLTIWRTLFYQSSISLVQRKRLALIGSSSLIGGFLGDAAGHLGHHYHLHGACITHGSVPNPLSDYGNIEFYATVEELLKDPQVDVIAFQSQDPQLEDSDVQAILHGTCEGLEVSDLTTLYKGMTGKVPLRFIDSQWLLSYAGIQGGPGQFYLKVKRLIDLLIASTGFLLALPLMLVTALLIKMDSRGAILFRQERLGRHRRYFQCLKFRPMVEQAEKATGPVWSTPGDPRVTAIGVWLRKTRLDELPQLFNVIRGDMSLIGPRPIRAFFADQLAERIPRYELRFALRPGLTGWAQVNHPYADSEDAQLEKFEYELFYIQNASLVIDCVILITTLRTIFSRKGR
jgi:exopolysaccharide biosynthesis polyprenyl glycosylphosphotransferase